MLKMDNFLLGIRGVMYQTTEEENGKKKSLTCLVTLAH